MGNEIYIDSSVSYVLLCLVNQIKISIFFTKSYYILPMWMHKSALFPIAGTFILAEFSAFSGVRHNAARTWFSIALAVTCLSSDNEL